MDHQPKVVADQGVPRIPVPGPHGIERRLLLPPGEGARKTPCLQMERQIEYLPCHRPQKHPQHAEHTITPAYLYAGVMQKKPRPANGQAGRQNRGLLRRQVEPVDGGGAVRRFGQNGGIGKIGVIGGVGELLGFQADRVPGRVMGPVLAGGVGR